MTTILVGSGKMTETKLKHLRQVIRTWLYRHRDESSSPETIQEIAAKIGIPEDLLTKTLQVIHPCPREALTVMAKRQSCLSDDSLRRLTGIQGGYGKDIFMGYWERIAQAYHKEWMITRCLRTPPRRVARKSQWLRPAAQTNKSRLPHRREFKRTK